MCPASLPVVAQVRAKALQAFGAVLALRWPRLVAPLEPYWGADTHAHAHAHAPGDGYHGLASGGVETGACDKCPPYPHPSHYRNPSSHKDPI